jgi:hypothetical protein
MSVESGPCDKSGPCAVVVGAVGVDEHAAATTTAVRATSNREYKPI